MSPVLRLHGIPPVAIGGPGHSHRWTFGGPPVLHRCPAPLSDMAIDGPPVAIDGPPVAIDGPPVAIDGPPVAIDGNENLKNGLYA